MPEWDKATLDECRADFHLFVMYHHLRASGMARLSAAFDAYISTLAEKDYGISHDQSKWPSSFLNEQNMTTSMSYTNYQTSSMANMATNTNAFGTQHHFNSGSPCKLQSTQSFPNQSGPAAGSERDSSYDHRLQKCRHEGSHSRGRSMSPREEHKSSKPFRYREYARERKSVGRHVGVEKQDEDIASKNRTQRSATINDRAHTATSGRTAQENQEQTIIRLQQSNSEKDAEISRLQAALSSQTECTKRSAAAVAQGDGEQDEDDGLTVAEILAQYRDFLGHAVLVGAVTMIWDCIDPRHVDIERVGDAVIATMTAQPKGLRPVRSNLLDQKIEDSVLGVGIQTSMST